MESYSNFSKDLAKYKEELQNTTKQDNDAH